MEFCLIFGYNDFVHNNRPVSLEVLRRGLTAAGYGSHISCAPAKVCNAAMGSGIPLSTGFKRQRWLMTGSKKQVQDICIIGLGEIGEEASLGLQERSRVMAAFEEAGAACLLLDPARYEEIPEETPFLILCVPNMAGSGEQAAVAAAEHFRRQWLQGKKDRRKAGIAVWIRTSLSREQLPPSLAVYRSFHDGSQMAEWVLQRLGRAVKQQAQTIRDGSNPEDSKALFDKLGPGFRIGGRYELEALLADHGTIRVYRGRSLRSGKPRAIRAVDKNVFHRQFYPVLNITRQIREDQLFVQRVLKIIEQDGLIFVSENWFEGESLHELLGRSGCPGETVCADWMIQLCHLINALHHMEKPIIFRDIKPENIILHRKKTICLVDPEAMREYEQGAQGDDLLYATEGFAAPEQYGGFGQTDRRTDIFGIGATCFTLLTGHKGPADDPYIGDYMSGFSPAMRRILEKCLQKDPDLRYQDCESLRKDFENLAEDNRRLRKEAAEKAVGRFLGLFSRRGRK